MANIEIGARFGAWVVAAEPVGKRVLCHCDCGTVRDVIARNLTRGLSSGCGCTRKHSVAHGMARRSGKTRTYRQWKSMRSRCKPNGADKANYAERGIAVCARWDDFALFLADMGECPPNLTLDRINNDKGYGPDNCRWADMAAQRLNQRRVSWVLFHGQTMTVQDAAQRMGVHPAAIWNDKRRNGVTVQEAVDRVAARRP